MFRIGLAFLLLLVLPTLARADPTEQTPSPQPASNEPTPVAASSAPVAASPAPALLRPARLYELRRPNRTLLVAGLGVFVGGWLFAAILAGSFPDSNLYIPVAGPFIAAFAPNGFDNFCVNTSGSGGGIGPPLGCALILWDAALQLGGLATAVAGLIVPRRVRVRTPPVLIVPMTSARGAGLGLVAHF